MIGSDINHQNIASCAFEFGTTFFKECATPLYAILTRETFRHRTVNRKPVLAVPIALSQFDGKFAVEITGLQPEKSRRPRGGDSGFRGQAAGIARHI